MSLLKRLFHSLGAPRREEPPSSMYTLEQTIEAIAFQEHRTKEEVAADLLELARRQHHANEYFVLCWKNLTPREQEVAVLVCQDYTNRQIATRLSISLSTVKTHVHNVLVKFGLRYRTDLQAMLSNWDFDDWV